MSAPDSEPPQTQPLSNNAEAPPPVQSGLEPPEVESPPPVQSGSEYPEAESPPPVQSGSESPKPEAEAEEDGEEEEEEGECGFCLYMKAGGCRDEFIVWEECIREGVENNVEDLVGKCGEVTAVLKQCMDSHADYYERILRAEKEAEKRATEEWEKEKEAAQSLQNAPKDEASDSNAEK